MANLPVAANLGHQDILDVLEILRLEIREVWVADDESPSHDRSDLAVKRQAVGEVEESEEIAAVHILFDLMRIVNIRVLGQVARRRQSGHERVTGHVLVAVFGAKAEHLHMVHARPLETKKHKVNKLVGMARISKSLTQKYRG